MNEKKKTKAQLAEELEKQKRIISVYRELADNLNDLIIITDASANITYANKAACSVSGYSREEALQMNVLNIIPQEYHPAVMERIARRRDGHKEIDPYEVEIIAKDGHRIFLSVSSTLVPDGNNPRDILLFARDISERKKIENDLKASEKKFREFADLLPGSAFECDLNYKVTFINKKALKSYGYTMEDIDAGLNILKTIAPEEIDDVLGYVAGMIDGTMKRPVEVTAVRKDGSRFPVHISASVITENGKPLGIRGLAVDVTEYKEKQEALVTSEKRFRQFAELLPTSAFECDSNFKITLFNRNALETFGYTKEDVDAGFNILNLIVPDNLDYVLNRYNDMLDGNLHEPTEIMALRKDGSKLLIQLWAAKIIDNDRVTGLRGFAIDITEQREKELALRQSEARYRTMINAIEDGYYEVDLKGHINNFNEASLRLLGWEREELLGASFKSYCSPEYHERLFQVFHDVYITGIPVSSVEMAVVKKDGQKYTGELSVSLIRDDKDNPAGFRGIVRDITPRKAIEEELRESRQRFKNMVANVPGIIFQWVVHQDGTSNLSYVSESIRELGIEAQELQKDPLKVFRFFQKEDKKRLLSGITEAVQSSGHLSWEGPTTINDVNRWHRCLAYPRKQDNGDIIFDGLILDMTESKKAEQEKRELEDYLQQAQKLEAIGTLAGGIAHDFNNLLMGIQGYTSLMLMNTNPGHPHYGKLKNIEEMVVSGASLTKQLLGYARRGNYEIKPVDINEIVEKTITMFGRTRKEISIHQHFEKDIWMVEVDKGQIEQVLLNLYVNAWQAMPSGGDLYLETTNVELKEETVIPYILKKGRYVKISVTDTGVGMDEATRTRIFEPFFTTKEMGRGTGLGLASAYGIVKGHGGVIDVESEKGRGTSFSIYFPASSKELTEEIKISVLPEKGTENILLVDDEEAVINVTADILKILGYQVLTARNGYDAVRIYQLKGKSIDLVILDMVMPGMNGGETFDTLKEINPEIKVILSSGYSLEGQAAQIMARGCSAFLQKPYKVSEISQKIREVLTKNEA